MARLPRLTIPGFPHHLIQRGNDRRAIFLDDADRERYLALLREIASAAQLAVHAYVLMPNPVHVLLTPQAAGDVGRAVQALGRRYVRWLNDGVSTEVMSTSFHISVKTDGKRSS